jgi:hypothetical protein
MTPRAEVAWQAKCRAEANMLSDPVTYRNALRRWLDECLRKAVGR